MWQQIVDFLNAHPGPYLAVMPAAGAGIGLALAKCFTKRYDPSNPYSPKPKCKHNWHVELSTLGASKELDYFGEYISKHRTCCCCGVVEVLPVKSGAWIDPVELKSRNVRKLELTAAAHRRLKELCDGPKPTETSNDRVYLYRTWVSHKFNGKHAPLLRRANGDTVVVCRFDNGDIGDPVGEDIPTERPRACRDGICGEQF